MRLGSRLVVVNRVHSRYRTSGGVVVTLGARLRGVINELRQLSAWATNNTIHHQQTLTQVQYSERSTKISHSLHQLLHCNYLHSSIITYETLVHLFLLLTFSRNSNGIKTPDVVLLLNFFSLLLLF